MTVFAFRTGSAPGDLEQSLIDLMGSLPRAARSALANRPRRARGVGLRPRRTCGVASAMATGHVAGHGGSGGRDPRAAHRQAGERSLAAVRAVVVQGDRKRSVPLGRIGVLGRDGQRHLTPSQPPVQVLRTVVRRHRRAVGLRARYAPRPERRSARWPWALGVAAAVHLIFGSPANLPNLGEVQRVLASMGVPATPTTVSRRNGVVRVRADGHRRQRTSTSRSTDATPGTVSSS